MSYTYVSYCGFKGNGMNVTTKGIATSTNYYGSIQFQVAANTFNLKLEIRYDTNVDGSMDGTRTYSSKSYKNEKNS